MIIFYHTVAVVLMYRVVAICLSFTLIFGQNNSQIIKKYGGVFYMILDFLNSQNVLNLSLGGGAKQVKP